MTQILYKPYKFLVKNIVLKRKMFINTIEYYPIKYKNNETYTSWVIQTPLMFIPFNLSDYESNNNYIDISFLSHEHDTDIDTFLKFVKKINKCVINHRTFKKYKFRNSLKEKTGCFPERLRINYNKHNRVMVFNEEKELIDISKLHSKMYGKFLVQISNIWVNKTKREYGLIWNISQIKLYTNLIYTPSEFAFIEDKLEENISDSNPKYKHYFFMKKIGLDIDVVRDKLSKDGLDPGIADIVFETNEKMRKYDTIKKTSTTRPNFLNMIGGGVQLKKIRIVKKKSLSPKNNLVPSQEDIQGALSRLRKI
jgi:hypothetical protein